MIYNSAADTRAERWLHGTEIELSELARRSVPQSTNAASRLVISSTSLRPLATALSGMYPS